MQDSNYVILVDENGQPYIAHSIWGRVKSTAKTAGAKASSSAKSAGSRAHKYIEKIGEGAKARYFYTQDELKAFYGRGKAAASSAADKARSAAKSGREALKTAKDRAEDLIGVAAKRELDSARDKWGESARRWLESRDSAEAATSEAAKAKEALDAFKAERRPFIMSARKAQELHEQAKELEAAYERASRDAGHEQLRVAMADAASSEDRDRYFSAVDKYLQTPLGALDLGYSQSAASTAVDKVKGTAASLKDKASEAIDEARDKATKAADTVKGTAVSLKDKASEAIDEARDKATKAADTVKGTVASLKDKAPESVDEASAFYRSPQPSLSTRPDGSHAKVTRVLQTEGLAEDAVANAGRSLSKADTIDDARRSASEKRMAEKELSGSRGSFDRWRESESQKEITASQARKLQEKLASGKELSQSELNQLMSFLMKGYK